MNRAAPVNGATVFLCHSSGDKEQVRRLYHRLLNDGISSWFDEESLIPGQDWEHEIGEALLRCRYVLACLSKSSIGKRGFVQKELRRALDLADEQPLGEVYLIPVLLEACEVPERLQKLHRVDLYKADGYQLLLRALRPRLASRADGGARTSPDARPASNARRRPSLPTSGVVSSAVDADSLEDLVARANDVRANLAIRLAEYVAELDPATGAPANRDFVVAVDSSYRTVVEWIDSGFGQGASFWRQAALRASRVDHAIAPYTADAFNQIRVEVSRRFGALDDFFDNCRDEVWDRLAGVIRSSTGQLLTETTGRAALVRLSQLLDDGTAQYPTLSEAVEKVLDIRLDYNTYLYPLVRAALDDNLRIEQFDQLTGKWQISFAVELTEDGMRELFGFVTRQARLAAEQARTAMVRKFSPALVVHAVVARFRDDLLVPSDSLREFRRLVSSYPHLLWPDARF